MPSAAATLLHDVRNCIFALESNALALTHVREDDAAFQKHFDAMSRQLTQLRALVVKWDKLLPEEPPRGKDE